MKMNPQYLSLSSLGPLCLLDILFNDSLLLEQLQPFHDSWLKYNPRKLNNRYGLSLFSLNGEMDSGIDLDSLFESNKENGTSYDEMSFRESTQAWKNISEISEKILPLKQYLGRSHILRLDEGGFFPPHRDLGNSFRLISFFNCGYDSLVLLLDEKRVFYEPNRLYFLDTRLVHALFSFQPKAYVLVLNVEICDETIDFVYNHLFAT